MTRNTDRRQAILSVALRLAETAGYLQVTRDNIALAAGCSPALVSHHLGTMPQMRRAIMGEALRVRCMRVIAQGLSHGDRRALNAPEELRRAAAAALT